MSNSYSSYSSSSSASASSSSSASASSDRDSKTTQIFFLCFSGILVFVLFMSKFLEDSPRIRSILSEPAMTLLVGIFCSFLVRILNEAEYEAYQDNYDEEAAMAADANQEFDDSEYAQEYFSSELPTFFLYFPSKVFFMALLPPILFNSGYQLQRELFYRHFSPIVLFSCIGTCVAAFGAGGFLCFIKHLGWMGTFDPTPLELMAFGALIAATDTVSVVGVLQRKRVDPHLFSLVFGESALNDAVAIVLFKTLADFLEKNNNAKNNYDEDNPPDSLTIQIGKYLLDLCIQTTVSPILGLLFAGFMGLAFKHCDFRPYRMLELSLYILPVYIPFILSEILDLSGMITIFFTGIFARRYMEPNVSAPTREYAGILFQLLSFLAEICIFLELGLSVFGLHKSYYFGFISWAFVAALLGRALSVYPLSCVYNFSLTRPVVRNVIAVTTCGAMDGDSGTTSCSTTPSSMATRPTVCFDPITMSPPTTTTATNKNDISMDTTNTTFSSCGSDDIIDDVEDDPMSMMMETGTAMNTNGTTAPSSPPQSPPSIAPTTVDFSAMEITSTKSNVLDYGRFNDDKNETIDASMPRSSSTIQKGIRYTLTRTSSYLTELPKRETPARKRDKVIPVNFMHILWFAGLRGAVAYACAREFPDVHGNKNAFIAATMVIVLVTIVLMGGATEPLMDRLKIRMNVDNDEYMKVWHKQRRLKGRFLHFEYNYIYRFVVRDQSVEFMDESCGYVQQVDDNEILVPGSGRRRHMPFSDVNNDCVGDRNNSGRLSHSSVSTFKAVNNTNNNTENANLDQSIVEDAKQRSLMDDSIDDIDGPVRSNVTVGNLDGELGYIQAQFDSRNSEQRRQGLTTTSSFDSGRYDWNVACKWL